MASIVYTAGGPILTFYYNIRGYNADSGSTGIVINRARNIYGLAVDSFGNIFAGDDGASGNGMRKYTSSGSLVWGIDHFGQPIYGVAADSAGNSYFVGGRSGTVTTRKLNSSGTEQWTANHGATVRAIAIDGSGNVYAGGNSDGSYTLRKYNSSGTLQWSVNTGANVYGIDLDSDENVYICRPQYIKKYNSSGTEITTGGFPVNVPSMDLLGIVVDKNGNIFICGPEYDSKTLIKFNSSGVEQWSKNHGSSYQIFCIALYEPLEIPGLPIALGLGIPSSVLISVPPGLEIPLSLGTPVSNSPLPPDPGDILVPVQTVYRLYITGGDWLELPMHSFQCRRRLGASTWVTVVVDYSAANRAALDSRMAGGGRLSIFSGVRYSDGTESSGEFLQAALTRIDDDQQFQRGTLTITGRVIPVSFSATSRTLRGVSMRGMDSNGRRLCECDVDPLLRPNDTVDDGVETWTAGAIDYQISPAFAIMRVEESI